MSTLRQPTKLKQLSTRGFAKNRSQKPFCLPKLWISLTHELLADALCLEYKDDPGSFDYGESDFGRICMVILKEIFEDFLQKFCRFFGLVRLVLFHEPLDFCRRRETKRARNPRCTKIPWGYISPTLLTVEWKVKVYRGPLFVGGGYPQEIPFKRWKILASDTIAILQILLAERTETSLCDFVWCFRASGGCWLQPFCLGPPFLYTWTLQWFFHPARRHRLFRRCDLNG